MNELKILTLLNLVILGIIIYGSIKSNLNIKIHLPVFLAYNTFFYINYFTNEGGPGLGILLLHALCLLVNFVWVISVFMKQ